MTVLVPINDLRITKRLVVNEFFVVNTTAGAATAATTATFLVTGIVINLNYKDYY
jgi:hypothetical protein